MPIQLLEDEGISCNLRNVIRCSDGTLMCCATYFQKRKKPLQGRIEDLVHARTEEEAQAMPPRGPEDPVREHMGTLIGTACFRVSEDFTRFTPLGRVGNRPMGLLEGNVMELKDGRFVLVHNPVTGGVGTQVSRKVMSVWISDDEMESWHIKEDVLTGRNLSYPSPIQLRDGRIIFTYDRDRCIAQFVEVTLE